MDFCVVVAFRLYYVNLKVAGCRGTPLPLPALPPSTYPLKNYSYTDVASQENVSKKKKEREEDRRGGEREKDRDRDRETEREKRKRKRRLGEKEDVSVASCH